MARPIHAERPARPPLAHVMGSHDMRDDVPSHSGRHHFFDVTSSRIALSGIASASSFLSSEFSSYRARSRFASDTSNPQYLAFQL